ncbi:hypothetical protein HYW59_03155 [Candidatus Kaiserbacteria bacterium]|nr:hypothetical protein [Candidatus Kaiserbacteria bacterium]
MAEEKNAYPTHMPGTDRYDLNSELMDRAFANPHETPPKEHVRIARAVALLGMLAVGPGVDEYRRLIGKKINMIPDEYRRSFLNTVLREILDTEQSKEKGESKTKMESRMFPHMVPERVSQMRQVRRAMWADRLRKVYGLKEEL